MVKKKILLGVEKVCQINQKLKIKVRYLQVRETFEGEK